MPKVTLVLLASTAVAQEVLPQQEPAFEGNIGRITKDSIPDFPKGVEAPQGAPNILLILTDDLTDELGSDGAVHSGDQFRTEEEKTTA